MSLVITPSSGLWFALIVLSVFVKKINVQSEVLIFAYCLYQVTKLLHNLRKDISALQSSGVSLFQDIRKRAMFLKCSCCCSVLHALQEDFRSPIDQTVLLSVDRVFVGHCEKDKVEGEACAEEEEVV